MSVKINNMPKIKTRKIAAKRFKVTKSGKILHRTQGIRHKRANKNKARQRTQDAMKEITDKAGRRKMRRILAI